jgi:DUF438 domain-containing protein
LCTTSKNARKKFESNIGESIQRKIPLLPFLNEIDSAKIPDAKIVTEEAATSSNDSKKAEEPHQTTNTDTTKYRQNNYSQNINVDINNGIINGFVLNLKDKG